MLRIVFLCSWCLSWNIHWRGKTNAKDGIPLIQRLLLEKLMLQGGGQPIRLPYLLTEKCQHGTMTTIPGQMEESPTQNPEIWEGIPWYYLLSGVTIIMTYCICIVSISCLKIWKPEVKVSDQKWYFVLGCFHCDCLQFSAFNKPPKITSSHVENVICSCWVAPHPKVTRERKMVARSPILLWAREQGGVEHWWQMGYVGTVWFN